MFLYIVWYQLDSEYTDNFIKTLFPTKTYNTGSSVFIAKVFSKKYGNFRNASTPIRTAIVNVNTLYDFIRYMLGISRELAFPANQNVFKIKEKDWESFFNLVAVYVV